MSRGARQMHQRCILEPPWWLEKLYFTFPQWRTQLKQKHKRKEESNDSRRTMISFKSYFPLVLLPHTSALLSPNCFILARAVAGLSDCVKPLIERVVLTMKSWRWVGRGQVTVIADNTILISPIHSLLFYSKSHRQITGESGNPGAQVPDTEDTTSIPLYIIQYTEPSLLLPDPLFVISWVQYMKALFGVSLNDPYESLPTQGILFYILQL